MYFPKYNLVKERVKMMVKYNQNEKKKKEFNGVKSNEIFDIINSFEQIYGHKLQVAPNFKKMIPRPVDKYLPSFMKNMYNRMGTELITDKTLQLNNFSNGDIHQNIYNNHSNNQTPKGTKKQKKISLFENEFDLNLNDYNDKEDELKNQINDDNINNNIKKSKIEINNVIKKMNKLYEYRNTSKC